MNEKNINEKIRKIFKQRRAECEERKRMTLQRTKKIPLDLLAKDWLDNIGASDELRVYLVENALPSLVLGLEDLLVEVSPPWSWANIGGYDTSPMSPAPYLFKKDRDIGDIGDIGDMSSPPTLGASGTL